MVLMGQYEKQIVITWMSFCLLSSGGAWIRRPGTDYFVQEFTFFLNIYLDANLRLKIGQF